MKRIRWMVFTGILVLTLCISLSTALAANSTSVILNRAKLTATNPYWVNGTEVALATPPASGWNAYFDTASNTLKLNNAVITLTSSVSAAPGYHILVYADGDIAIELTGDSTVTFISNLYSSVMGIKAGGSMSIGGSGNLDVQIENRYDNSIAYGINAGNEITVFSGGVTVDVQSSFIAFGMSAVYDILLAGGNVQASTLSSMATSIYSGLGDFRMTGGSLTVDAQSTSTRSVGIFAYTGGISLEGGAANVSAYTGSQSYALFFADDTFTYKGGNYTFTGFTSALRYYSTNAAPTYSINGGTVYVSEYSLGHYPTVWRSGADGMLATNHTDTSPFKFVQFLENIDVPQTGDAARPLLWLGITGSALLGIFIVLVLNRSTRRRNGK